MINNDIKIAFWGNSDFSLFCLEEMKKKGILPSIIVTSEDKPVGRKMLLTPTPTKKWAEENSIEYITPKSLKNDEFIKKISEYNLFIVASYGKIIPKIIIDIPEYQVLNIHPSLLPKYRGPSPLQEQILNDEKEIGVTLMLIDELVDHGPIIAQKKVELQEMVGFYDLEKILAKEGSELLSSKLNDWIKGKIQALPQDDTLATFTKKIEKEDGLIDITSQEKRQNYLKVLAYEAWPVAYFEIKKGNPEKIFKVKIKSAIWKDGDMQIQKVLPEGKKEMDYKSFLNGLR
jgi:methionyl-tRNA formyltransferase